MSTIKAAFPHTGRFPNEGRRQAVKAMYESGMSARTIAQSVGISPQAVLAMLKRMDVPRRPRGGNTGAHSRHAK